MLILFAIFQNMDDSSPMVVPVNNSRGKSETKYITVVPGFGPNNQYLGVKDILYIAKRLGRTFGTPDFFLHAISDASSLRTWEDTFDTSYIQPYVPAISLQEFHKECGGVIDGLVWTRTGGSWKHVLDIWMSKNNFRYSLDLPADHDDLHLPTDDLIFSYFRPVESLKCIAVCFPFRLVAESTERKSLATLLEHAPKIKETVKEAFKEAKIDPSKLLTIHWRWGEDTCGRWLSPAPHTDYDFCWGTAVFHFAKLDDILVSLRSYIDTKDVKYVYLAVSPMYHDKVAYEKLFNALANIHVQLIVSANIPVLAATTDNYILSLVEQEICSSSAVFIASGDSTWSDFVRDYHREKELDDKKNGRIYDGPEVTTFEAILSRHSKDFTSWNRVLDIDTLNMHPRGRGKRNVAENLSDSEFDPEY